MAESKQLSKQLSKVDNKKPADKKPPVKPRRVSANSVKPNTKMLIVAGVLIAVGSLWFTYSLNTYGALRAWTDEEKKLQKQAENDEKQEQVKLKREKEKRDKLNEARKAAGMPPLTD